MKVIEEGTIDAGGNSRYYCVKDDERDVEDDPLISIVFCVASSESIQVYELSELFSRTFEEMDFETEEHCKMCNSTKDNCSVRLAHRLEDMSLPLSESEKEPPTPIPEYICKSCAYQIADIGEMWAEENKHQIATRTL